MKRCLLKVIGCAGAYIPWVFLIAGGVMGAFPGSAEWNKNSAYLVAAGLLFFSVSYVLARIVPRRG